MTSSFSYDTFLHSNFESHFQTEARFSQQNASDSRTMTVPTLCSHTVSILRRRSSFPIESFAERIALLFCPHLCKKILREREAREQPSIRIPPHSLRATRCATFFIQRKGNAPRSALFLCFLILKQRLIIKIDFTAELFEGSDALQYFHDAVFGHAANVLVARSFPYFVFA